MRVVSPNVVDALCVGFRFAVVGRHAWKGIIGFVGSSRQVLRSFEVVDDVGDLNVSLFALMFAVAFVSVCADFTAGRTVLVCSSLRRDTNVNGSQPRRRSSDTSHHH